MNIDEILKNIYSDSDPFASNPTATFTVTVVVVVNPVAMAARGGDGGGGYGAQLDYG